MGHKDTVNFASFYYRGTGCKKCKAIATGDRSRYTYDFIKQSFEVRGYMLVTEKYENCYQKLECICPNNHVTKTKWVHFVQGHGCFECGVERRTGENNGRWKADLDRDERIIKRKYEEYTKFQRDVRIKYKNICVCCGNTKRKNMDIDVHHMDGYNWCIEKRTDVNNGVTLCEICHDEFHAQYGYGDNTEEQFLQWFEQKNEKKYQEWMTIVERDGKTAGNSK